MSQGDDYNADNIQYETAGDRIFRKMKEQPLVPFGVFVTTFAIVAASISMLRGNSRTFQQMLRLRVVAQGFTVAVALGGGVMYERQRWEEANKAREAAAAALKANNSRDGTI